MTKKYNIKILCLIIFSSYINQVQSGDSNSAHSESTMSVSEMTKARLVGKTYKSKYGGTDLVITYKKDGKVYAKSGQWTSGGTYKVKEDGTLCVNFDNSQWTDFCRLFSTFYVDKQ